MKREQDNANETNETNETNEQNEQNGKSSKTDKKVPAFAVISTCNPEKIRYSNQC